MQIALQQHFPLNELINTALTCRHLNCRKMARAMVTAGLKCAPEMWASE